jgi:hypothetical protein
MNGYQIVSEALFGGKNKSIKWKKDKYGDISTKVDVFGVRGVRVQVSGPNGSWLKPEPHKNHTKNLQWILGNQDRILPDLENPKQIRFISVKVKLGDFTIYLDKGWKSYENYYLDGQKSGMPKLKSNSPNEGKKAKFIQFRFGKDVPDDEETKDNPEKIMSILTKKFGSRMRMGDVIGPREYRNWRTYIHDGKGLTSLYHDIDDYGSVPPEMAYPQFPLTYWTNHIDHNTVRWIRKDSDLGKVIQSAIKDKRDIVIIDGKKWKIIMGTRRIRVNGRSKNVPWNKIKREKDVFCVEIF